MKVIFCDIDGVLNSYYGSKIGQYDAGGLEERKVKNLKKIMDLTGAEVVISSRLNSLLGKQFNELRINQITAFGLNIKDSITDIEFQESKAIAINRWLTKHPEVDNFVVLDDCASDLKQRFENKFILITGKHGLTYATAQKAIEILNK